MIYDNYLKDSLIKSFYTDIDTNLFLKYYNDFELPKKEAINTIFSQTVNLSKKMISTLVTNVQLIRFFDLEIGYLEYIIETTPNAHARNEAQKRLNYIWENELPQVNDSEINLEDAIMRFINTLKGGISTLTLIDVLSNDKIFSRDDVAKSIADLQFKGYISNTLLSGTFTAALYPNYVSELIGAPIPHVFEDTVKEEFTFEIPKDWTVKNEDDFPDELMEECLEYINEGENSN